MAPKPKAPVKRGQKVQMPTALKNRLIAKKVLPECVWRGCDKAHCVACDQSTGVIDRNSKPSHPKRLQWIKSNWKGPGKKRKEHPAGRECYPCFYVRRKHFVKKTIVKAKGKPFKKVMKKKQKKKQKKEDDSPSDASGSELEEKAPMSLDELLDERKKEAKVDEKFWELRADYVSGERRHKKTREIDLQELTKDADEDYDDEHTTGTLTPLYEFAEARRIRDWKNEDELVEKILQKYKLYDVVYDEAGELVVDIPDQVGNSRRYKRGHKKLRQYVRRKEHATADDAQEAFEGMQGLAESNRRERQLKPDCDEDVVDDDAESSEPDDQMDGIPSEPPSSSAKRRITKKTPSVKA